MAERNIIYALQEQDSLAAEHGGSLVIPEGFLLPGFVAAATCLGYKQRVNNIEYQDPGSHQGLLEAFQVPYVLLGVDGYAQARVNVGSRYSPMQMLETPQDVDRATTDTTSCIRKHVGNLPGISGLCSVIGELHDNVRAHAEGAGFSMALIWRRMGQEDVIEFALADAGKGFWAECQRRGIEGIDCHETAIDWCLRPRNSTKDNDFGEFAQRLEEDAIGNPFGEEAAPWHNGNHHQGLGLDQLMKLVSAYNGDLWVASGDAALVSTPWTRNDQAFGNYVPVRHWQGVAIACRLKISELGRNVEEEPLTEAVENLLGDLLF